ncbi:LysM peptidoglycan-binding domain-containing protein [bacterium]|nr:MAG: LysM peptidoglycan-binding domain-containing protein [bacterium]
MFTTAQPAQRRPLNSRLVGQVSSFINATTRVLAASQRWYRPRFLAHAGLVTLAALVVSANDPATSHSVAVRLMSSQSGIGGSLDGATVASLSADVATSNQLMIVTEASRTATKKNEQVALLSTADDTLAKRQVVSTAGTATRDIQKYSVTAGDTLSTIASKFGITTATIKWANDLDDADFVRPGQQLTILPVSGLLYTVSGSDSPESLANAYQANAAQILSYNNAELKGLAAGQQIIIPDGIKPAPARPVAT